MNTLQEVYQEWQNNLSFREDFKKDPEQALKKAGFEVTADDLNKIKAMLNLKSKNEKLDDRINR